MALDGSDHGMCSMLAARSFEVRTVSVLIIIFQPLLSLCTFMIGIKFYRVFYSAAV